MRILIAGGGEVASLVARRMIRENNQVVIVEQNDERARHLEEAYDLKVVTGSAASVRTMREAGIESTEMLIAVTDSDEINLLACEIAAVEAPIRYKVARLRTPEVDEWRRISEKLGIGIDLIIHPESEMSRRLLEVLPYPGVSEIVGFADGRVKLFGMNIDSNLWLCGKTLKELEESNPPESSLVAMIFRGSQVIVPRGSDTLEAGDHVYIICTDDNLHTVIEFMGLQRPQKLERVFILGGKQLGILVAQHLEQQGVQVKLFERDVRRCEKITTMVRRTVVVNADGTDEATLVDENVLGVSAFLALTNDDEDNIIASLLARRLGAKKIVALINRLNYLPLGQRLGINTMVSPRLMVVDRILQFVRKGHPLSVTTFREEEAEAIELRANAGSKFVGRPLKDLHFPKGAIAGAIARSTGEVVIPRGDHTIEAGDHVIFFALEKVVPQLESALLADTSRGLW